MAYGDVGDNMIHLDDRNLKLALGFFCEALSRYVICCGMVADNMQRSHLDQSMAYGEDVFNAEANTISVIGSQIRSLSYTDLEDGFDFGMFRRGTTQER